jgi:hypothetical protein
MELKLVYRTLRKISDWAVARFYSEIYVDGIENVPEKTPLIMYVLLLTFDLPKGWRCWVCVFAELCILVAQVLTTMK